MGTSQSLYTHKKVSPIGSLTTPKKRYAWQSDCNIIEQIKRISPQFKARNLSKRTTNVIKIAEKAPEDIFTQPRSPNRTIPRSPLRILNTY